MTVAIVYGMYILILRANAMLILILVIYLCGLGWWFMRFLRHFQRMDKGY
jgi:hypothetical protein